MAVWFFAASPIRRSLFSVNATYEGVVRLPWSLAIISTRSFCQTPTHEYVVPRSIPTDSPVTVIKRRKERLASVERCSVESVMDRDGNRGAFGENGSLLPILLPPTKFALAAARDKASKQ